MDKPPTREVPPKGVLSMNSSSHSTSKSAHGSSSNGSINNLNGSPSVSRVAAPAAVSSSKKPSAPSTVAAAPAGDDFFKTFGV